MDGLAQLVLAGAGILCLALLGLPFASFAASKNSKTFRAEADVLFTNDTMLRLQLQIPDDGTASLRCDPGTYVKATLRDGNTAAAPAR